MIYRASLIFVTLYLFFVAVPDCLAVLPDSVYKSAFVNSKIKVIGIVTDISSVSKGRYSERKKLAIEVITVIKPEESSSDKESSLFCSKSSDQIQQNDFLVDSEVTLSGNIAKSHKFQSGDIVTGAYNTLSPGDIPPPGGTLYYYPNLGDRVFVTISRDDGELTSYTKLTPDLEKALKNNLKVLRLRGTEVVFKNPIAKTAEPVNEVPLDELETPCPCPGSN